jgi:hypothetical protein
MLLYISSARRRQLTFSFFGGPCPINPQEGHTSDPLGHFITTGKMVKMVKNALSSGTLQADV